MARCLVLGADGFIGSHLTEALLARGHRVRAFDHFAKNQPKNLAPDLDNMQLFAGDFHNKQQLKDALDGIEYVFHFISTTNQPDSAKDPFVDLETNVQMSVELFELCATVKVKRVIFPSSGGTVYGRSTPTAFSERDSVEPVSPYAIGKATIESYLRYFKQASNLDSITFRISTAYGERQNLVGNQGVIPIFLNLIKQAKPLPIMGDGQMVRDYIYVKDIAETIANVFDKPHKHSIYNLASSQPTSLSDLIKIFEQVTGQKTKIEKLPPRPFDVSRLVLDTTRLVNEFNLKPSTPLKEGIARTWQYILSVS